ncbi:class II aldolase/adducin family protein [Pseudomonas entomophila]|uniref:class II aldolase/adducin family protein n=1 Tax=Pseudomonas entomophila TaxID=312306 RepID=UPI001BD018D7|nr:class II aldolase/adducin family protein [Pseudomonas entomophila]QVM89198.1 class II aldolase/adducin family protein [Pseudomonas entomophila]
MPEMKLASLEPSRSGLPAWFDITIGTSILQYGQRLATRELLVNTLGNIVVRRYCPHWKREVMYTKHLGLSLEESGLEHLAVLDMQSDELLHGLCRPSLGHQMHREIMRCRPDIHATVHLHPDDVIAFFSVMQWRQMKYVSNDTALVMGKPPCILGEGVNVELDVSAIGRCAGATNCIVMPGHGITSFGRDLSEAYHRAVAFVAEIRRLITCQQLSAATGKPVSFASEDEVQHMYELGEQVIYGSART